MLWIFCLFSCYSIMLTIGILTKRKLSTMKRLLTWHMPFTAQCNTVVKITVNVHLTFSFLLDCWASFRFSCSLGASVSIVVPDCFEGACAAIRSLVLWLAATADDHLLPIWAVQHPSASAAEIQFPWLASDFPASLLVALASFWSVDRYSV